MSDQNTTQLVRTGLPDTLVPHTSTPIEPLQEGDTRWRIFLTWVTPDIEDRREQMRVMLEKAGMDVFPAEPMPETEAEFKQLVDQYLAKADASLTLLGGAYGEAMTEGGISRTHYQYDLATATSKKRQGKFKRLFWNFPLEGLLLEGDQQRFINDVQNNLTSDVMFTTVNNGAQLIEDIRVFLERDTRVRQVVKEYDMAFIANVADAADCYHVIEKLSEELKLKTLTVVPENDQDYRAEAAEMILKSKLTVVFFKDSSDWAISFVKQLWKHVGGASTETPFLLIGEDEPRRNRFIRFKAPQTQLIVVPKEQVLETLQATHAQVSKTGVITEERFCPYTGLRPFNEDESIFFKGRERHADFIIDLLERNKFSMVTGSSGDGKSSLVFAGVLPNLKGGFLKTSYSKWAVAALRPERAPLRNLATALADQMRIRKIDEVENALSYGFSALVDLYKKSDLYVDITSEEWANASEEERKAMRRKASNLLILVDQFEEFFTNAENYRDGVASPTAQITINVLVETVRIAREEDLPIYVVCTMRSDYIGQCVAFRGFAEMIGLSTYYVPRLKREEIQEVVEAPAQLNGDKISLRLTQRLLNDLGDGIDQLPVLQHCLHQVWTDANGGKTEMDLLHYAQVGGLAATKLPRTEQQEFDAWFSKLPQDKKDLFTKPRLKNVLNRHANELYENAHLYYNNRYSPAISKETAQAVQKTVFVCLTKIDENRAVRNRMTLQQIAEVHGDENLDYIAVGRIVNLWREPGNTFIQPFITDDEETRELTPNTVLDITHESLIRNWERLVEWAETENKSVVVFTDLMAQVDRWLQNDCDPKYLLASGPFNYFTEWYTTQRPNPAWVRRYLPPDKLSAGEDPLEEASNYLLDIEFFLEESRRRLNRVKRFRNIAFLIIAGLFVAAVFLAIQSRIAASDAIAQKAIAEQQRNEAERARLEASINARLADDQRIKAQISAIQARNAALQAEQQKLIAQGEKLNAEYQAEIANNQRKLAELATERANNEAARALEQQRLAEIAREDAETQRERAVAFSKNAVIQRNNALILQSLFLSSLSEQEATRGNAQVGHLLALEALPKTIGDTTQRPYVEEAEAALYFSVDKLLNANPPHLYGHLNKMIYNQFSPDSKQLVTTSLDKTARVWDVSSKRLVSELKGHSNVVEQAYFSDDSRFILTVSSDYTARLWDVRTRQEMAILKGATDVITHATFDARSQKVLVTSADSKARVYEAATGNLVATLEGHADTLRYGAFSPDGNRIVTTGNDNQAILWDVNGRQIAKLSGHGGPIRFAAFSPTGYLIATVSDDKTTRLWNGSTGAALNIFQGHTGPVLHCDFRPDGKHLATASADNTIRIWNLEEKREIGILRGEKAHTDAVYHIEYSSDNLHLLSTSDDRRVILWDAGSFLRLADYPGHPGLGYHATFSPDGKLIATAGFDPADNRHAVRLIEVFDARQALLDLGQKLQKRELSEEERVKYFLSYPGLQKEIELETEEQFRERQERLRRRDGQGDTGASAQPLPASGRVLVAPKVAAAAPSAYVVTPSPKGDETTATAAKTPVKYTKRYHEVLRGETLWSISKKYNTTVADLQRLNGIRPEELAEGTVLLVSK